MNTTYSFEYSLDSGYITNIQADFDAGRILMTFEGISRDSYLTIKWPAPLVQELNQDLDLEHLEDRLVLFIDELPPPDYEIVADSKDNIVTIGLTLPARSEKLEILGERLI